VDIGFDEGKRRINLAKHGLDLADARRIFAGIHIDQLDDRFDYGEDRYITAGMLGPDVVICVWADWVDVKRIISLRRATADEQKAYFESFA
jgi:uncharacterized DUF497 family protein